MKVWDSWKQPIAGCLAVLLVAPVANAAAPQQKMGISEGANASQPVTTQPGPDSAERAYNALPDSPIPATQEPSQTATTPPSGQQTGNGQQNSDQKPVGTAAAPYEKPTGVAASRPAGAVIAPAKQRRIRRIWISVAVIAGAAVAVGTVAGLSEASSSKP